MCSRPIPFAIQESATREGLHDEHFTLRPERDGQLVTLTEQLAVDEYRHVLAHGTLVIQHVAANLRMLGEEDLERFAERRGINLVRGAVHMARQLRSKFEMGHQTHTDQAVQLDEETADALD